MQKKYSNCIKKQKYSNTDEALRSIIWLRKNRKINLVYYECPVCLDFHLTKKGTSADFKKVRAEIKLIKKQRFETQKRQHELLVAKKHLREDIEKKYREFKRLFNAYCRDNGIVHKKPPTILKGVLPRAERLRILAEMQAKSTTIDRVQPTVYKSKTALINWYNRVTGKETCL